MTLIGVDEVGRGCWAGPLLVVALQADRALPNGLTDSKQLTKRAREQFATELEACCQWGEGWVSPAEIDALGLTESMRLAVRRALDELGVSLNDEIIMDGNYNYCPPEYTRVQCLVKADAFVPEVSAASIIAKVRRDAYMVDQDEKYPNYGFAQHVGYGTAAHVKAMQLHGITEIHRKSFKPVQKSMNI